MYEKVNPSHPDKMADRLAGAIVDMAYARDENPKIAVEVLAGHGLVTVMIETSLQKEVQLGREDVDIAIERIFGPIKEAPIVKIVQQDAHLAANQRGAIRCGDNGIFKGEPVTTEQRQLTCMAGKLYENFPTDGKYLSAPATLANGNYCDRSLIVCQSNAAWVDISYIISHCETANNFQYDMRVINPLGPWTGGPDVDCGATNRKLGSDMGDGVTGGGLHGKDLSKADVSVNIMCHLLAQAHYQSVEASCAIGDTEIMFVYADGGHITIPYDEVVARAREYITSVGGFEKFAEWGLIRP